MDEFQRIDEAIERFNGATKEELLSYLDGDDEVLMQITLLNLDSINSQNEAEKIIKTITEHSSETREYCAFLVNRLMKNESQREFFAGDIVLDRFAKAISDVNPKVCRKIIEILPLYKDIELLLPILIKNSYGFIEGLQEKNKNKNYQYNTLSFRLYWNIFGIACALNTDLYGKYEAEIIDLLKKLFEFKEYTLREKAALLAQKVNTLTKNKDIEKLLSQCHRDENFFVKEIIS